MKTLLISIAFLGLASFAQAKENMSADAQAVDAACTQDAATAGCGNEKVGTGLMKCIHAYKQAHKDFKVSEGCKTAMHKMHDDKKAGTTTK
jgi:hypothetical protein